MHVKTYAQRIKINKVTKGKFCYRVIRVIEEKKYVSPTEIFLTV